MAGIEPPSHGPRDARRDRAGDARRRRIRRRRAALGAIVAGLVVLVVVLLTDAGSSGKGHSPGPARRTGSTSRPGTGGPGKPSSGARGAAQADSGESPEIHKLIALGKPIYCAARRGNEVALTFDDGPGPYTRLVIAKLRKHGVRGTFFVVGRNLPLIAGATREERTVGSVGDHTFTHPLLTGLAPAQAESEIVRTQAAVARASGAPVFLFRPPYGAHDARIDGIAREHGLLEILWTVDSADSLGANYAGIEHNVISGLHGGAIILMHENRGQTVRALLNIFAALQRKHLRAVSVPQLLTDDPPSLAQVRAGGGACGIHGRAALSGG